MSFQKYFYNIKWERFETCKLDNLVIFVSDVLVTTTTLIKPCFTDVKSFQKARTMFSSRFLPDKHYWQEVLQTPKMKPFEMLTCGLTVWLMLRDNPILSLWLGFWTEVWLLSYLSTCVSILESPSSSIFILFGRDSNWKINLTDILDKRIVAIRAVTRGKTFFSQKKKRRLLHISVQQLFGVFIYGLLICSNSQRSFTSPNLNIRSNSTKYEMKYWHYAFVWGRVPTRTGKPGKPGKMGRHFPVREKSGNFEQTGKVREKSGKITQNTGKLREFEINIIWYFYILFWWYLNELCIIAKMDQVFSKENKTLKKYWKIGKNTGKVREKSGNFVSSEKWEPCEDTG